MSDAIKAYRDRLTLDVVALDEVEELLGELDPELRDQRSLTRAVIAKVDEALAKIESPTLRNRGMAVDFLRNEPTAGVDEIGLVVLRETLGSRLAESTTDVGVNGVGANATRFVWSPHCAIGFVDRRVFNSFRGAGIGDRLVVLDPKKSRCGWDDLFGLVIASPSRVQHVEDLGKNIIRGTGSLKLLRTWASCNAVKLDVQRRRIVAERVARVEASLAAAE